MMVKGMHTTMLTSIHQTLHQIMKQMRMNNNLIHMAGTSELKLEFSNTCSTDLTKKMVLPPLEVELDITMDTTENLMTQLIL